MHDCYAIRIAPSVYEGTGEGGIRTLGSLLGYGALAKHRFACRAARRCYFVAIILPQDTVSVRPVSQTWRVWQA
jgi:hypothetical protein